MKKLTSTLAIIAMTASGVAVAHPGHDHSHFLSGPIHMVTALAVVCALYAVVHAFINRKKNTKKQRSIKQH